MHRAGLLLLSSSRVYSIPALAAIPLRTGADAFTLDESAALPPGMTLRGIGADFSTAPPVSLYGSTKLASECVALEYGEAFDFPVWITRCGVLAGAGQFGTPDQGIFSYWINAHLRRRPLRYIGFDGKGHQVRDAFHPRDLAALLDAQMTGRPQGRTAHVHCRRLRGNAMSLCPVERLVRCPVRLHSLPRRIRPPRPYDIPWVVMDSSDAERDFGWQGAHSASGVLEEIAQHAEANPDWLERSGL